MNVVTFVIQDDPSCTVLRSSLIDSTVKDTLPQKPSISINKKKFSSTMVLSGSTTNRRASSSISNLLIRLSLFVVLGIIYLVTITKAPSEDNHHWSPPFLDWILHPAHDTPPSAGTKNLVVPNGAGDGMMAPTVMNVPKLQSKLKLNKMGSTQHVGMMVDAGRHYFPIDWLESLLDYMAGLGFNLLHLRLSDDQAFAFESKSHPEMAVPAPFANNQVYSVADLTKLVAYAKKLGITIVPELNVPGHAASWHHIPGLIMPCPRFICTYGYAIPLNIASPKLMPLLKDILTEFKSIFGTDYLHLGGDELEQAEGCYEELEKELPDYAAFEESLEALVHELGFKNVIRWERSGSKGNSTVSEVKRAGDITQYWVKSIGDYAELPSNSFSSASLYMDVNEDENGYKIYSEVRKTTQKKPQGLIVGTFELGTDWWMDRNVFGRMIAVSMGLMEKTYNDEANFLEEYEKQCSTLLGENHDICQRKGEPLVTYHQWRGEEWDKRFTQWKIQVCTRVTEPLEARTMRTVNPLTDGFNTRQAEEIALARKIFIKRLQKRQIKKMPAEIFVKNQYGKLKANSEAYVYPPRVNRQSLFKHRVGHTGVTVDLSRYFFPMERLHELVQRLSHLGFNTLHLRLVDDFSFAVKTKGHPDVAWASRQGGNVYTYSGFRELVAFGHEVSVEIIPEVNMVSRAGGWFAAGFVAPCPNHICEQGYGIPLNLTNVPLMAVVSNVLEELRLTFNSPFLHLGYDERAESLPCLEEAGIAVDFDEVEKKVTALLAVLDIPPSLILRWQTSDEHKSVRRRAGAITHYQSTDPPKDVANPFFVSTDLRFDRRNDDAYEIYRQSREYAEHDQVLGVLAGTLEMSPQAWNGRNVEGKLIAVALGLSSLKELNEDEFKAAYTKACGDLNIQGDIAKLFGKARWSEDRWQEELISERGRRTNSTCARMTGQTQSRKMKDEVLG